MMWHQRADVVVVGTGVAGLVAALAAHRRGRNVVVLSKAADTATFYAQGGIAVVLPDTDDSIDAHVADTIAAGAGLCDPDAVRSIVSDGYRAVRELVDDGARFDEAEPGRWSLTREGGHSRRRIIHSGGDATGAEVQRALDNAAATLDIRRNHVALEILHLDGAVTGVHVLNEDGLGIVHAPSVILATGGLGHLFSATTNPEGSTGDGVALALWAGVPISDIEFIQFHPTMLFDGNAGGRRPLITEAVRGEGGILLDRQGNSITAGVHPMGDLAPRDVVAGAIDARLRETGDPCAYLDARDDRRFRQAVPDGDGGLPCGGHRPDAATDSGGSRRALQLRRRRHRRAWPHRSCGIVRRGRGRPHRHARREPVGIQQPSRRPRGGWTSRPGGGTARRRRRSRRRAAHRGRDAGRIAAQKLQRAMSRYASVVRDADGLQQLTRELEAADPRDLDCRTSFEDVALTTTARAVAGAALARNESRGCHHRSDFPDTDPALAHSQVIAAACC